MERHTLVAAQLLNPRPLLSQSPLCVCDPRCSASEQTLSGPRSLYLTGSHVRFWKVNISSEEPQSYAGGRDHDK